MAKLAEIDLDIKKIAQIETKLVSELNQLDTQEKETLRKIDETLVEDNGKTHADELVRIRIQRDSFSQMLSMAREKAKKLHEEKAGQERAEEASK